MALVNLIAAAAWHFSKSWGGSSRWLLVSAIILVPYWLFGRAFASRFAPRTYRYAPPS